VSVDALGGVGGAFRADVLHRETSFMCEAPRRSDGRRVYGLHPNP
jgi:hypothetical protein